MTPGATVYASGRIVCPLVLVLDIVVLYGTGNKTSVQLGYVVALYSADGNYHTSTSILANNICLIQG